MRPPPRPLVDRFGRQVRDLRVSVTDRCNFSCVYCMPEGGMRWLPRQELLSFEEIEAVVRVMVGRFGIESVRLTGGEPTVRAQLPSLVARLASIRHPSGAPLDLSMTTNGASLRLLAGELRRAGLRRVNISCDSLRPERFSAVARRDALDRVLDGVDAAIEAGFSPVKLNVVTIRGYNDDEAVDFAAFGRAKGVQVRFIEFMPLDAEGSWSMDKVVPAAETLEAISKVFPLEPVAHGPEPAALYRFADGAGEIGVVASVTRPFCGDCDRVRLTAEGQLRACLFSLEEHDLRAVLRSGGGEEELAAAVEAAVAGKWAGHRINRVGFRRPGRSMSQIGG
ncbi:MAG TPA: GTP 3',8-cyclase MoaA [Acidimicrobiales bacterium]|nr:GTP 3',8-cyclase MoaA [Acidimicrobiales bacterium]